MLDARGVREDFVDALSLVRSSGKDGLVADGGFPNQPLSTLRVNWGHVVRGSRRSQFDTEFPVFSTFRDFDGKFLIWSQPAVLTRLHVLSSGEQLYAVLRWQQFFGSLAKANSSEGTYTLKRGGFLNPFVSIRDATFDADFAVLRMNLFSGGTLEFVDGRRFTFTRLRFWNYEWSFKDENGGPVCSIRKRASFKHSGDVVVFPNATRDKHLMVAIIAAWYAIVMASEEAAAVAASA